MHKTLIIFGYKSSGKTHFGRLLAQELGSTFIDTDFLIEELYEKGFRQKLPCRQIAINVGEQGFRHLERTIIDSLDQITNTIISVGGGAVLHPGNCFKLETLGRLVYLEANKETIKQRIFSGGIPSFLDPENPERSFEKMYDERKLIYSSISALKINVQGKTDRQVLDELICIATATKEKI